MMAIAASPSRAGSSCGVISGWRFTWSGMSRAVWRRSATAAREGFASTKTARTATPGSIARVHRMVGEHVLGVDLGEAGADDIDDLVEPALDMAVQQGRRRVGVARAQQG